MKRNDRTTATSAIIEYLRNFDCIDRLTCLSTCADRVAAACTKPRAEGDVL